MKKIYETWRYGWEYLFSDELSTYYTYFTVILAECALFWIVAERTIALQFTIILIGCILNVIICALLKGIKEELWVSILYIGVLLRKAFSKKSVICPLTWQSVSVAYSFTSPSLYSVEI